MLAFLPLGVWVLLQAQRIDTLARRVAELERQLFALRGALHTPALPDLPRAERAPAFSQDELVLTEVVPEDVLVLDNPVPEASNDTGAPPQVEPGPRRPRMASPLLLEEQEVPSPAPAPLPPSPEVVGPSSAYGELIGVIPSALAFITPALIGGALWPSPMLSLYLALAGAAGFSLAIFRRWSWVALATLCGLYFWFFAAVAAGDVWRGLALATLASVGGALTAVRKPKAEALEPGLSWSLAHELAPSIAISVSSALLIWAWLAVARGPEALVAGPALIGIFHIALASYGVRERKVTPVAIVIATAAMVLGFIVYARARLIADAPGADFYPMALVAAACAVAAALFAKPHHSGRVLIAAFGGASAALLTAVAAFTRSNWHGLAAWAPLLIGALALTFAAWRTAASAANAKTDAATAWWTTAAAALLLLGVESAFAAETRTLGHAGAALVLSSLFVWRSWQAAGWAALGAATLSMAQAVSPILTTSILSANTQIWLGGSIYAGAAALLFGASTLVRRRGDSTLVTEGLSAAAIAVSITGALVTLRWLAAGGAGMSLDAFTETSLRVIALMTAGLLLLPRIHETPGLIGAWRGHILLGLGLVYAFLSPVFATNPWWGGAGRAIITGPPVFNPLVIAFAAPAALAAAAANRLYAKQRKFARVYAVLAALLAVLWAAMEMRHGARGAAMASPEIGLFESACYALAALGLTLAATITARVRARRNPHRPFTEDLSGVSDGVIWIGLGVATAILLVLMHPIWGVQNATASNALSTMLAVFAQLGACVLSVLLARTLAQAPVRLAAAWAAALFAWSFGHCVIRWLHHRGYMDDGVTPFALEGLAHALWPLVVIIGAVQLMRLRSSAAPAALVRDFQKVCSIAIWPALGFAVLGMGYFYNAWWGLWPAQVLTPGGASTAALAYVAAAILSYMAPDIPNVRGARWMAPAATVAVAIHAFVLLTLVIRWLHHGAAMNIAAPGTTELWVYSAAWGALAGVAVAIGAWRADPLLRWIGMAAFIIAALKIVFVDTAHWPAATRVASVIGVIAIAAFAVWMLRRNRPPPGPGDLITVKPSARRERRRVRRRTSQ